MTEAKDELPPKKAIRRFGIFAEYTRQDRVKKGEPEDVDAGYGIWLAKVVSSRKFGAKTKESSSEQKPLARRPDSKSSLVLTSAR